jgi:hypothetical protein
MKAEYDPNGKLVRFSIGGCTGSFEGWERLSFEWAAALEVTRIKMFHMKAFEARKDALKQWDNERRKVNLNIFLDRPANIVADFLILPMKPKMLFRKRP